MEKEDVKITKLYENLTQNIEELLENEKAEILLEVEGGWLARELAGNMKAAALALGTIYDTAAKLFKGSRIILTKPWVEKLKVISEFFRELSRLSGSKELGRYGQKFAGWASDRANMSGQYKLPFGAKKVVDPKKITSIIDRLHSVSKRGLVILQKQKSLAAGAVVAAGVATAGIMVYKKYLSAGARACKEKQGADKQKCLIQFRVNAYKAEISSIRSAEGKCNKSNDPMTCRKKLDDRIKNLQSRIKILEGRK